MQVRLIDGGTEAGPNTGLLTHDGSRAAPGVWLKINLLQSKAQRTGLYIPAMLALHRSRAYRAPESKGSNVTSLGLAAALL
jgi:hypothetical protein